MAYIDDSWSSDNRVFALACYVAPQEHWNELCHRWSELLMSGHEPVSEFKTSHCRNGAGEFKGWSPEQRKDMMTRAVDLVVGSDQLDIKGFAFAFAADAEVPPGIMRDWERVAFQFCALQMLLTTTISAAVAADDGVSVQVCLDRKDGFSGDADKIFEQLTNAVPCSIVLRWGDSKTDHPLQIADLLAHETAKEAGERIAVSPRSVSVALKRLVEGRLHIASCCYFHDFLSHLIRNGLGSSGQPLPDLPYLFRTGKEWRSDDQWPKKQWGTVS